MREVLISIQPKWVEKIVSGKKTVEVRKTKPKLETPFKCYIYCTKDNTFAEKTLRGFDDNGKAIYYKANKGKVIGEFVCDRINEFSVPYPAYFTEVDDSTKAIIENACLKPMDIHGYNGTHQTYGWHISDLVIYDKPRELSEFKKINRDCWYADLGLAKRDCPECKNASCMVQRPPQSWCYIEPISITNGKAD